MTKFALPEAWFVAGSHPQQYDIGIDPDHYCGELQCACLRSIAEESEGFGTFMQSCGSSDFLGERIRFSAQTKTLGIQGWAGLWLRIDRDHGSTRGEFDNMTGRELKGTNAWQRHSIVLDVAPDCRGLAFGVLLNGEGTIWAADFKLEIVDKSIPSTNLRLAGNQPPRPTNMDLSQA